MPRTIKVDAKKLYNIAFRLLTGAGVPEQEAAIGADVLNMADCRGVKTHGLNKAYLYLYPVLGGAVRKETKLEVVKETASTLMIDAHFSLGIVAAQKAMRMAVERAQKTGVAIVAMRRSAHFGMAGYYSMMAANEGLVGFAVSGTPNLMVPTGGKRPALSNSPWSIAFPGCNVYPDPIMLDMANTVAAGSKVEVAKRAGKKIPLGWCLDHDGNPTDDPNKVWGAAMGGYLPFGGAKGYCVGFMWDLMSSVLPGAGFGPDMMPKSLSDATDYGQFFMAYDPACFRDLDQIKADMDRYVRQIKASPRLDGVEEIFVPGEIEMRQYHKSLREGVDFDLELAAELVEMLKHAGILPGDATLETLFEL